MEGRRPQALVEVLAVHTGVLAGALHELGREGADARRIVNGLGRRTAVPRFGHREDAAGSFEDAAGDVR